MGSLAVHSVVHGTSRVGLARILAFEKLLRPICMALEQYPYRPIETASNLIQNCLMKFHFNFITIWVKLFQYNKILMVFGCNKAVVEQNGVINIFL